MGKKYGNSHKEAKQHKLKKMNTPRCEMTNSKMNLQAHHVVPKLFNGPDMAENYQILSRAFHEYIHAICNVPNNSLVQQRLQLARRLQRALLNEEKSAKLEEQLDDVDDVLIKAYVENMIHNISGEYKDAIMSLTIQNNFHTIKKLTIEVERYKLKELLNQEAHETDGKIIS